jgi:hypothetical protein
MMSIASIMLGQGGSIDALSRGLAIASLAGLVGLGVLAPHPTAAPLLLIGAACLAGLVQLWFAARVAMDAALFREFSRAEAGPDWVLFDEAMIVLRLLPESKTGRPTAARIAGAFRLLTFQIIVFLAQVSLLGAAAVAGAIR